VEHIASHFTAFPFNSPLARVGHADAHNRNPRRLSLVGGEAELYGDGVLAKATNSTTIYFQMAPWKFNNDQQSNLRRTFRHSAFVASRLLSNLGVASSTPLLDRFSQPVLNAKLEKRCLDGLYLDQPEEWDDPYRFFRW
jgi:hypothetical protein